MPELPSDQITVSEPVLEEGHPDWRPWSGGAESPLEELWGWMVRNGVGGLSEAKAEPAPPEPTGFAAVDAAASAETHD